MSRFIPHPVRSGRRQRGDTLLVVMIFLLVCLMGLVVSMRGSIVTTQTVANNLQRQKDMQIADVALAQVEQQMLANSQTTGQILELSVGSGASQPSWWRDGVNPAVTAVAAPDNAYWASCATSTNASTRCASFAVNNVGSAANTGTGQTYNALVVVQPAGRTPDKDGCRVYGSLASFYTIYIHVQESSGVTSATTETVYRLCTKNVSAL